MSKYLILLILFGCSMKPVYKKTDHYDPEKKVFFNPTSKQAKSLWQVFKWKWDGKAKKWPAWRELEHKPSLGRHNKSAQINLSFVGHSSFLIEHQDINILTDPVWSHRVSPVTWAGPARHHAPGVKLEDLPKIDVVIISHNHYDHMDLTTLKKLEAKFKPVILCPLGDKALLDSQGLSNVKELDWWQSTEIGSTKIHFTPAQHFSGRGLFDRFESLWGGYVIELPEQKKIFFGGDTGYSSHFQQIREKLGGMDFSLIPIGAYEPRWFMKAMHMNPADSVQAHLDLGSKQSVGIHFGTFQLTDEAIDEPLEFLDRELAKRSVDKSSFIALKAGQSQLFDL